MKVSDLEKKLVNGALIERVEGADLGQLQTLSKSLSAPDRSIVLFGIKDRVYVFASAGTNTGKDAEEIVKLACENLSGRGGGTKALAQGICNDKDNLDSFIEKLRRSL